MSKSLDGVLIKKANQQETWTENSVQEIAKCLDPKNGYRYFMENYFHIQHPVRGRIKFEPYEYQKGLIESYHNHRFSINMLPRQSGKCFLENTIVRIKHAETGEERTITVGELFAMQKDQNNNLKP
jgi:hypothetical protein